MVAGQVAADRRGEGVRMALEGVVQGLGDDAALEGGVAGGPAVEPLVDRPTDRAVVEDRVAAAEPHAVVRSAGLVADPDPEVPDDDVARPRRRPERVPPQADPVTRRGLPGDRQVGVGDGDRRVERDHARDPEDHRPGPVGLDRGAE